MNWSGWGPAQPPFDAEVLVLYDEATDLKDLTARLAALAGQGKRVLAWAAGRRGAAGAGDDGFERRPDDMKEFLNVALPKGRLGERVYAMFAQAGFPCEELLDPKRKLILKILRPVCATSGSSRRMSLSMWSGARPMWGWRERTFCWSTAQRFMSCWT